MKRPYAISTRAFLAAGLVVLTAQVGRSETIDTSGTVERSDNITGGLTKKGSGTVRLTGDAQTVTGAFETQAGTSKVVGSLSVSGWVGVISPGILQIPGSLSCAADAGLWMNPAAQVSVSGNLFIPNILAVKGGTFRQTDGSVDVSGAADFGIGGYDASETSATYWTGTYELNGGTLNVNPNFHVGRYSPGTFLQTGGTANVVGVHSLGRYATGVGVAKHTGGVFNQTTLYRGYIVGEEGSGELTVDGDATVNVLGQWGVALGSNAATASGLLRLYGGTLAAQKIQGGSGTSRAVLNGGTLKALKDTNAFIADTVDVCEVGEAGVTIDTDGHTVSNARPIVAMTPSAAKLTHRWSFNGSWDDSVGGGTATAVDGAVLNAGATACVLPGGAKGAGAVNLGTGLLPTGDKGFTLEFWMTENALQNWCRVFSVGTDANNCIWMAFTYATQLERGCFAVVKSASSALWLDNTLGGFGPLGTEYHVAVVAEPKGDGTYRFSIYKQNAVTGETLAKDVKDAPAGWTPACLDSAPFWLGRSLEANDDASASYNEVRIWDAPFSEEELSCRGRMGPDRLEGVFVKKGAGELALSGANTFTTPVRVEAGTLSLPSGATLTAPVTIAAGGVLSVAPGSVPAAVSVEVGAADNSAGCLVMTGAALDLGALSVTLANAADLDPDRSYVVVRSSGGFVGALDSTGLPKRWRYVVRGNEVRLCIPKGLSILVR